MGDRANVKILYESRSPLYLYTHWGGSELPAVVQYALREGRDRWTDPDYLTAFIFKGMVRGCCEEVTGHGISTELGDGDDRIIVVDLNTHDVHWEGNEYTQKYYKPKMRMSFEVFCALGLDDNGWTALREEIGE